MDKKKLEKDIFNLASPIAEELGYELLGIEYLKEEGEYILRAYIDKSSGINIDDCATVSRALSNKLDEVDPIEESYFLEVSSPGPNRILVRESDFEKYSGHIVKVKFIKLWENKKYLQGILRGLENNEVIIETNSKLVRIDINNTSFIKLNDE